MWRRETLRRIGWRVLMGWFVLVAIPKLVLQIMYALGVFVPEAIFYYPPEQLYWMHSGLLQGWAGVGANMYVFAFTGVLGSIFNVFNALAVVVVIALVLSAPSVSEESFEEDGH